mmetsp:Transcript_32254/g.47673  ORF Transcript_32254/g.47673 Transcript_32254/m.47673 type:complete len:86 (+) Transcript_32254:2393-2650(+)
MNTIQGLLSVRVLLTYVCVPASRSHNHTIDRRSSGREDLEKKYCSCPSCNRVVGSSKSQREIPMVMECSKLGTFFKNCFLKKKKH